MAQKSTYSTPRETEADRIATAERAKERKRVEDFEQRQALEAAADAEVKKVAVEVMRTREDGRTVDVEVLEEASEERLAQRLEDEELYETLLAQAERKLETFYARAKTANNAALSFVELSDEMRVVCNRLGKPNAIRASVMGVADGTGVITDPIRHTDEIWARFVKLYRAESGIIDMDVWERLP